MVTAPHDRANRYNGDDSRLRESANFGGFGGEDELSFDDDDDDDLLAFDESPANRGGLPLPSADPALNDAAFEDDPLTHGALNDAALADPARGLPGPEGTRQAETCQERAAGHSSPAARHCSASAASRVGARRQRLRRSGLRLRR